MSAVIGSRWLPGHVERRDTSTGFYEQINSPMTSRAELEIQRALLRKTKTTPRAFWARIDIRSKK